MKTKASMLQFAALILLVSACSNFGAEKQNLRLTYYEFSFDNSNPSFFGFELIENDESVGPKSIIIYNKFAFIVDTYHSNIKRVNLLNGELISSPKLEEQRAWLRDIIEHNGKLYVLADLNQNFILDKNLNLLSTFALPSGPKYGIGKKDGYLSIYSGGKLLLLGQNEELIGTETAFYDVINQPRNKVFHVNDSIITTEYGQFYHEGLFETTWKFYDSINFDYDDSKLVFFVINTHKITLYIINKR